MAAATRTRPTRRPPGLPPGPRLPQGVQLLLWFLALGPMVRWCRRRFGVMFTLHLPFNGHVVQVCVPDAVRAVFAAPPADARAGEANGVLLPIVGPGSVLLLDGERHMAERKLMLPAFHGEAVRRVGPVAVAATAREVATWGEDTEVTLRPAMQRITLEVILRTVFGAGEEEGLDELRDRLTALLDTSGQIGLLPGMRHDWGPRSPWGAFLRRRDAVDAVILRIVTARRAAVADGTAPADILTALVEARDDTGRGLTDRELRDELMTLLVAGHETTATAMTWFLLLVLRDADALARLRAELDAPDGDGSWLDACIRETLRIRPVVPVVARRLHAPLRVLDRVLPAGVAVAPNIYAVHRDPQAWPDPLTFKPERMLGVRPDPAAFLPFGGGVRRCLGASFAMVEMRAALPEILRLVELKPVSARPEAVRRRAVTLVPAGGGRVRVRRRVA